MNRSFMPTFKTQEELAAIQLAGLKWTVRHGWEGSLFYREKLMEAGVTPDQIQSLEDLKRLPFVTAKDYMVLKVEREDGGRPEEDAAHAARIERAVRKETLVSGQVEIVDYHSLPRTERKSKRVFDHRT